MNTKRTRLTMLSATFGMLAATFGIYLLISCFTLLYNHANTDIVLYTSVLPEVLSLLIDLTEVIVFAVGFSFLIFSTCMGCSLASVLWLTAIFSAAALFRRVCDLIGILIIYHSLAIEDMIYAITYFVFDLALILAILGIIRWAVSRYGRTTQVGTALFSDSYAPDLSDVYPFRKFYSKGNPVQRCLLIIGIILASLKVLSRVIFDIDYGAPESIEECLIMAVYYLSDLLFGFIFYLIASFVLSRLFQRKSR